jgi:O-acetyl-ADP-ribose deacetylase (regulator of RNase III)
MADGRLRLLRGDITKLAVDAIVNAANTTLLGGGGVDGAIHRAAGPDLLAECRTLGGCRPGEAKITRGYDLPARFVIHTVGPVWSGGTRGEPEILADCYRNSLRLAIENGIQTIAFPAISCGVYRYPIADATRIAVDTTNEFLRDDDSITAVTFAVFSDDLYGAYRRLIPS